MYRHTRPQAMAEEVGSGDSAWLAFSQPPVGRGTLLFNFLVWDAKNNEFRNPKNGDLVPVTRSNYF